MALKVLGYSFLLGLLEQELFLETEDSSAIRDGDGAPLGRLAFLWSILAANLR